MRKFLSLFLGLMLALSLAGTTLAATSGATTTVSVTVQASISLSNVPATYSLGSGAGGTTLTGTIFTAAIVSSEPSFDLNAKVANFTDGGTNVIGAAKLTFIVDGTDKPVTAPDTAVLLASGNAAPNLSMKLAIPATARAGAYTTLVTWTASN